MFRIALASSVDHRPPHFLQGAKACRVKRPTDGIEPAEKIVITLYVFLAGCGPHKAGPEHVRLFEQTHQGIFGSAFYVCPCNSSLFSTVGTRARDVAKGHLRVKFC